MICHNFPYNTNSVYWSRQVTAVPFSVKVTRSVVLRPSNEAQFVSLLNIFWDVLWVLTCLFLGSGSASEHKIFPTVSLGSLMCRFNHLAWNFPLWAFQTKIFGNVSAEKLFPESEEEMHHFAHIIVIISKSSKCFEMLSYIRKLEWRLEINLTGSCPNFRYIYSSSLGKKKNWTSKQTHQQQEKPLKSQILRAGSRGRREGAYPLSLLTSDRTQGNGKKMHQGKLRLGIRKRLFTERMISQRNKLPREVVMPPNLSESKEHMDNAVSHMV